MGDSSLLDAVEERKECYLRAIVQRQFIKHPNWLEERGFGGKKVKVSDDQDPIDWFYNIGTICDVWDPDRPPPYDCKSTQSFAPPDQDTGGDLALQAIARMELATRHPELASQLYPWLGSDTVPDPAAKAAYWKNVVGDLRDIDLFSDNADFGLNHLIRLLYLYGRLPLGMPAPWIDPGRISWDGANWVVPTSPYFDDAIQDVIKEKLLRFKYWHDLDFFAWDETNLQDARKNAKNADGTSAFKDKDLKAEMEYWSENHQALFATAQFLAGQLWPDEVFRTGETHRSSKSSYNDLTGRQHQARAKERLLNWLNDRLRFGFAEWNAPGYYDEHFFAVLNLAAFSLDDAIQTRALMVADLMIFDLARFSHGGSFGVAAGRAHWKHKCCGWQQSVGDLVEILFGSRGVFSETQGSAVYFVTTRRYVLPEVLAAIGQAKPDRYIERYRVSIDFQEAGEFGIGFDAEPDVMRWWSRASWMVKYVINGTRAIVEKYKLQGKALFSNLGIIGTAGTFLSAAKLGGYAAAGPFFPALIPVLGNPFKNQSDNVSNALSVLTEGSAYTRGNLYVYRNRNAMLSSTQNFHSGQISFQSHSCQATLSLCAHVFTSHPSAGIGIAEASAMVGGIGLGGLLFGGVGAIGGGILAAIAGDIEVIPSDSDGPDWWTGSLTQPRVVQMNNAAILAYHPTSLQKIFAGHRTHAWFPKSAFDANADADDLPAPIAKQPDSSFVTPMPQVRPPGVSPLPSLTPKASINSNVKTGAWIFGRVGDGYVALYSAQKPEWTDGVWKDHELLADGERNIFIIQIGNKDEYGSYWNFKCKVLAARIHVNGLNWGPSDFECSYDIPRTLAQEQLLGPGSARLELHYDLDEDNVRIDGQPFADNSFPRFENPYIKGGRALWGQFHYTIEHGGHTLTHDFRDLRNPQAAHPRIVRDPDGSVRENRLVEKLLSNPTSKIEGRGSSDRPALAVAGSVHFTGSDQRLFMAWKGVEGDSGIYWAWMENGAWTDQRKIEGVGSSHAPALASYTLPGGGVSTGLFLAWKGIHDDQSIYFSQNADLSSDGWAPQEKIGGVGTAQHPALAEFDGAMWMVWRGVDGDHGLYWSRYWDGTWQPQAKMPNVGSTAGPAMAVCDGRLLLFWKGVSDDSNVYHSSIGPGPDAAWEPQDQVAYLNIKGDQRTGIGSSNGPAVAVFDQAMLLCWKGVENDSSLYFGVLEGGEYDAQVRLRGTGTSAGAAAIRVGSSILLCWKGIEDDSGIYSAVLGTQPSDGVGHFFSWTY
jgi:hypothetical protein